MSRSHAWAVPKYASASRGESLRARPCAAAASAARLGLGLGLGWLYYGHARYGYTYYEARPAARSA